MDSASLQKIIKSINASYPKTKGCTPSISRQADGRTLLIFSYTDSLPGNQTIRQTLRVVVDDNGRVAKKSISRG